jgi:hypothetical protein
MIDVRIKVRWASRGGKARSPANPAYPDGVVADLTAGQKLHCPVPLPYPAKEVGTWLISCETCGYTAAVTAAGRRDDPREARLPCRLIGRPAGSA